MATAYGPLVLNLLNEPSPEIAANERGGVPLHFVSLPLSSIPVRIVARER